MSYCSFSQVIVVGVLGESLKIANLFWETKYVHFNYVSTD